MGSDWIPSELVVVLESPIPRSVSICLATHPSRNQQTPISELEGQGPNLVLLVHADFVSVGVGGIISHITPGAGPRERPGAMNKHLQRNGSLIKA
jgi:hypothetical protein